MDLSGNCTTLAPINDNTNSDLKYLLVPLLVILLVMFLSALVYLMARRKRRLNNLRHSLLALYDFDSNEQEWESLTNSDCHSGYNSTNM